ncbi:MAG: helicase-related protein, partial [Patescibacteria group bacterium]|nr:helicase-related protein [Patescibacteria group bacterium]
IQEKFMKGKIDLICATNAFGMGIDKDNIRFVIHYDMPGSLENYYQEVGRGGRDRKLAHAYLLFYQNDIKIQLGFIKKLDDKERQLAKLDKLKKMIAFCQKPECLNLSLAKYFQLDYQPKNYPPCNRCKHSSLNLSSAETEVFSQISTMKNIAYFTCYLVAILQPKNERQWRLIPGIGENLANIYQKYQNKFD